MDRYIQILQNIMNECFEYISYYQFNRSIDASILYREGRIDASNKINILIDTCINKGKICLDTLKSSILNFMLIGDCEYSKGFNDQLLFVKQKLNKEI